jgi:tRNA(fMet)-specific endonuclease VapC
MRLREKMKSRGTRHYMPDTNALSVYASGRCPALKERMDAAASGESVLISAVVLAEMKYGWMKAGETRRVVSQRTFAARFEPKAFDEDCAEAYGVLKNYLFHGRVRTHGNARPIGERDMLIAAHALALRAVLVTHNTREFSGIPGLEVEDWESED